MAIISLNSASLAWACSLPCSLMAFLKQCWCISWPLNSTCFSASPKVRLHQRQYSRGFFIGVPPVVAVFHPCQALQQGNYLFQGAVAPEFVPQRVALNVYPKYVLWVVSSPNRLWREVVAVLARVRPVFALFAVRLTEFFPIAFHSTSYGFSFARLKIKPAVVPFKFGYCDLVRSF